MVNTRSDLIHEIPFKGSNPPTAAMPDTNTIQQLQNYIAEMERHHEEELRKLKADHNQLKAHFRHPQDDDHSAHTLSESTQGKLHPGRTTNTKDDPSLSHIHYRVKRATCRHSFVNCVTEADIPLGWKPLSLERFEGTTDPDEHPDVFLAKVNLFTNDDAILCRVFATSLKRVALT